VLHQLMDAGGFKAAVTRAFSKPKEAYRMPGGGDFNYRPPQLSAAIRRAEPLFIIR